MKKITFILLMLLTGTAFGQTASSTATADIVSPITIDPGTPLNFGKVSNTGGKVVIDADTGLDATSTTTQIGTTSPAAAVFTVNASLDFGYTVTLPAGNTITLTNTTGTGGETMNVTSLHHNSDQIGDGADEDFNVGGTLTVDPGQQPGTYTGTLTVEVAYN